MGSATKSVPRPAVPAPAVWWAISLSLSSCAAVALPRWLTRSRLQERGQLSEAGRGYFPRAPEQSGQPPHPRSQSTSAPSELAVPGMCAPTEVPGDAPPCSLVPSSLRARGKRPASLDAQVAKKGKAPAAASSWGPPPPGLEPERTVRTLFVYADRALPCAILECHRGRIPGIRFCFCSRQHCLESNRREDPNQDCAAPWCSALRGITDSITTTFSAGIAAPSTVARCQSAPC